MGSEAFDQSLTEQVELDAICMQFEQAWRQGERLSIESLLAEFPKRGRPKLLLQLLLLEFEYLEQAGIPPAIEAYLTRFSGEAELVRRALDEHRAAIARQSRDATDRAYQTKLDGTVDHDSIAEGPGSFIGRYKLLEQIGEGGMGVVYMADQQRPVHRKVALKIIKPGMDTKQVVARFEAERQALAMMDHPNIARVLDAGSTESGRPFFVMDLVRGVSITEYCDQAKLSTTERLQLFKLVCQAVQHAHTKGIIHRDLKPTNVMVTLHDGRPVPRVIDFGLSKAMGQQLTEKTMFTAFAQMVGTPLYMSPEQAEMSGLDVDTRSDIYSLGVLLYELLTGTTPFDRQRIHTVAFDELRRIIREEEPETPSTRFSSLGESSANVAAQRASDPAKLKRLLRGELDWIVMKTLEKDRRCRYETASALVAEVERYLNDQPVEACPPSAGYRIRKFLRRHRVFLSRAVAVVLMLSLATAAVTFGWKYLDGRKQQIVAETQRQAAEVQRERETAARKLGIPEIQRLVNEQRFVAAYDQALETEAVLPGDPTLARLRQQFVHDWTVQTEPAGANVFWKDYDDLARPWKYAGRSPVKEMSLPKAMLLWKLSREGYEDVIGCRPPTTEPIEFTLDTIGDVPKGMVRVSGNAFHSNLHLANFDDIKLDDFYMDRHEVTNRQFQEFVAANGYTTREYWDQVVDSEQGVFAWTDVANQFVDRSGLPGPATWQHGTYPEGEADHPVRGVSWYEATAYARFVGKRLPTVVHWMRGCRMGSWHTSSWKHDMQVAANSYFDASAAGPAAVGPLRGVGPFGTCDAAGNVAEWCSNKGDDGKRMVMGAAWDANTFTRSDQSESLSRKPTHGIRCVKLRSQNIPTRALTAINRRQPRDNMSEVPIDDTMYEWCRSLYVHPKTPLNVKVISKIEHEEYVHEVVEIDAAYDGERFAIHLMLPKQAEQPLQPVVYFPGVGMFQRNYQDDIDSTPDATLFLVQSGRASVRPIYDGSSERFGRFMDDREWHFHVFQDFKKTIDYLETRPDMDHLRIGYLGLSLGSFTAPILLAMENRIRAATLTYGGLTSRVRNPIEKDAINYAPRITIPVLMINGRDDEVFRMKESQAPLYHFLGSGPQDKAWILLAGGHTNHKTRPLWKHDVVAWFDQYLGPVEKQQQDARLAVRGNFAVARGDWAEAARLYSQAAEIEQLPAAEKTFEAARWLQAAVSLLMAGDEAGYRELCSTMIEHFAGRAEPWICERVLLTCLLRPGHVDVSQLPLDAVARAVDQAAMPESVWRSTCSVALAKLRAGNPQEALLWAGRVHESEEQPRREVKALSLVISALAQQQLSRTDDAQASLAAAAKRIDEDLPKGDDGAVDPHSAMRSQHLLHNWLIAEILRREAEGKISTMPLQATAATGDAVAP